MKKKNVSYMKDCQNESVLERYPIITPTQKAPNVVQNTHKLHEHQRPLGRSITSNKSRPGKADSQHAQCTYNKGREGGESGWTTLISRDEKGMYLTSTCPVLWKGAVHHLLHNPQHITITNQYIAILPQSH